MSIRSVILLHIVLAAIVIAELSARLTDNLRLEYAVKPLIMIWMSAYFMIYRKKKSLTLPVLAAFFFSWSGDNLLMFTSNGEQYFYAGVGGFFLAQISCILWSVSFFGRGWKGS